MAESNTIRLKNVGPIDPVSGFPRWFGDGARRLELVLDADFNAPAIGELPAPLEPQAFPDNFPDEAFYFMAEARLIVGGNGVRGRGRIILALEAAFGGAGEPAPGANVVFARIRVRLDDVIPNEKYSVYHPYGSFIDLEADDRGRVFHTVDLGIVEGDPTAVLLSGQVAPFLVGTSAVPTGYIGDGATDQQVTGGPFRDFVAIKGPRIREEGGGTAPPSNIRGGDASVLPVNRLDPNYVFSDLFTVQGRIVRNIGATVDSAIYEVTGGQTRVHISAHTDAGADLRVSGPGFNFQMEGSGENYSVIGAVPAVPPGGTLINLSDLQPFETHLPVGLNGLLMDRVDIVRAVHNRDNDTLEIEVSSSDPAANLDIPAMGLTISQGVNNLTGLAVVPGIIEVTSDKGGSARQQVELRGASAPPAPVEAKIALRGGQFADEPITLDGSGSPGATGFAWTLESGPAAAISNAAEAITTAQPSGPGSYMFKLTVQGQGGPKFATASVPVAAVPASDGLAVSLCQYRTGQQQFRVVGSVAVTPNTITVRRNGTDIGTVTAGPDGGFAVRTSLLGGASPQPGDTLEIRSKRTTLSRPIAIRN